MAPFHRQHHPQNAEEGQKLRQQIHPHRGNELLQRVDVPADARGKLTAEPLAMKRLRQAQQVREEIAPHREADAPRGFTAEELGFRCVGWSVMAWDWDRPPSDVIERRILSKYCFLFREDIN